METSFDLLTANLLSPVVLAFGLGLLARGLSYIAAPASVRASLPAADAGRCVTASPGLTFPFNLALGIPAYAAFARWLAG